MALSNAKVLIRTYEPYCIQRPLETGILQAFAHRDRAYGSSESREPKVLLVQQQRALFLHTPALKTAPVGGTPD